MNTHEHLPAPYDSFHPVVDAISVASIASDRLYQDLLEFKLTQKYQTVQFDKFNSFSDFLKSEKNCINKSKTLENVHKKTVLMCVDLFASEIGSCSEKYNFIEWLSSEYNCCAIFSGANIPMEFLNKSIALGISAVHRDSLSRSEFVRAFNVIASGSVFVHKPIKDFLKTANDLMKESDKNFNLSRDEVELLKLIKVGRMNKEIAFAFNLSEAAIKARLNRVFRKIGCKNRVQAISAATTRGLI